MARKTWHQKFLSPASPVIEVLEKSFAGKSPGSVMLIPTPQIIEEYIRLIPSGEITTVDQLRNDLALQYKADFSCPLTTGIFLRIVIEKNYEDLIKGEQSFSEIAPFWRILNPKMPLIKKLSFSFDFVVKCQLFEKS